MGLAVWRVEWRGTLSWSRLLGWGMALPLNLDLKFFAEFEGYSVLVTGTREW